MVLRIKDVIAALRGKADAIEHTVDVLESGDENTAVRGIVAAFMPSQSIIEEALRLGANLIIAHEGLYYRHRHQPSALQNDVVYQTKSRLIEQSGIAIYRYHDYGHRQQPDIIMSGLLQALDWERHVERMLPDAAIVHIPGLSVRGVAEHLKSSLCIPYVRLTGDPAAAGSRIGVLVGYRGGADTAIPLFQTGDLDLIIAGEGPEWETPEYVRDAIRQGQSKAYIALGHAESEQPGMRLLAERLHNAYPDVPVHYVPAEPIMQVI